MTELPAVPEENIQQFKAGTRLITENEMSRRMFIIKKGKARVFKAYLGQRITLAILGPGEIFGEMSFVDAEPRSASVEALTDLSAIVVDGDKGAKQIQNLPDWVFTIFRTVFHRFRELDQKITVLQSVHEFRKKTFNTDSVSATIFLELVRFNKTFQLLYTRDIHAKIKSSSKALFTELDGVLGKRYIGLRVYWNMLKEHDFMDSHKEESDDRVVLNANYLEEFDRYLQVEIQSERFLILSHSAISILRKIVGFTRADESKATSEEPTLLTFADLKIERMPLFDEALKELEVSKILTATDKSFQVLPGAIYKLYTFQTLLKAFDHSHINAE